MLRARSAEAKEMERPAALGGDPLAQEVLERVGRLLQRDAATVRNLARMLEAVEAMAPAPGASQ